MKTALSMLGAAMFLFTMTAAPCVSAPRGSHRSSSHRSYRSHRSYSSGRVYYGGGRHTTSHGGHYAGGHGPSHKGGRYKNVRTGNRYGRHK